MRRPIPILIVLAAGAAAAGCGKTATCRPGTLFADVRLGSYASTATELDVDVLVAGGTQQHKALTLSGHPATGGVEIDFPNGYPTGQSVDVTLRVVGQGTLLATSTKTVVATGSCAAFVADFGAPDGGGGAGGTGGGGGAGGAAGATGGAGGAGNCVATGPEKCFNNIDDDCDGQTDCADSDCGPSVAQCVSLDPTGTLGLLVNQSNCPTAFGTGSVLMNGVILGACTGCSCGAPTGVTCTTTVSGFQTAAECSSANSPGESVGAISGTGVPDGTCPTPPNWVTTTGSILGVAVTPFVAQAGPCAASGTARPGAPTWNTISQFCATSTVGGGCGAGHACIPALPNGATGCQIFDGAHACPTGATETDWYTGFTGASTCGACSCGSPTNASCDSMRISIGSDFSCNGAAAVGSGGRTCFAGGIYQPPLQFVGTPNPGTCAATSAAGMGTLAPTGRKTVCCR